MSRAPHALLWDMDGTIVNSDPLWERAATELLAEHNATITRETGLSMVGLSLWKAAEILQQHGVALSADEIVERKVRRVLELYSQTEVSWRPGARETLAAAKHAGIPNVMVTMALSSIGNAVAQLLPENTFSKVLGADQVTAHKPHPEPYLRGAALAGADIRDCLIFEDSVTGIASGAASGGVTVGVRNLVDISNCEAHIIVDSLQEYDLETWFAVFNKYRGTEPVPGGYNQGAKL
ncbi:HAD family phosphatase [Leucobacter sp. OH2974_COT-288]|uniref:HAD superfamily hydrolase (TIGR01509 family) n=1 Tax=Canibacter oris TaxID=1365628 RepID=A0A840DP67_9MICO|nr:HAD family phosphatase [Canibacter oris]MBB4071887.1 HAD superfamily hydrolase (TIGR01509 family) [Canibacter oris]RRD36289.1 HAD family phosphatase [Leucobacter sp. OH2974_COT-288]